jgi:hypothetical protein
MTTMESNIRAIYTSWNAGNLEAVLAAFSALGPQGYKIEYVGNAPLDGKPALEEMWSQYGCSCTVDIVELLVNGNEAAVMVHNNVQTPEGIVTMPSIETYKVSDGSLIVRYYHSS